MDEQIDTVHRICTRTTQCDSCRQLPAGRTEPHANRVHKLSVKSPTLNASDKCRGNLQSASISRVLISDMRIERASPRAPLGRPAESTILYYRSESEKPAVRPLLNSGSAPCRQSLRYCRIRLKRVAFTAANRISDWPVPESHLSPPRPHVFLNVRSLLPRAPCARASSHSS